MEYHHQHVQLHCRTVCQMGVQYKMKPPDISVRYSVYSSRPTVFGVWLVPSEEDAAIYLKAILAPSCKRSVQKAIDVAAHGVPYTPLKVLHD